MPVNLDQRVISGKFNHNNEGFNYFIGYLGGGIVEPFCIILPQMSEYIKQFENGCKNMSFLVEDDEVRKKYDKIWDVIENKLGIKFHSEPIYKYKYLKTRVRESDGVIKTKFCGNGVPKENTHNTCIVCITIDSILEIEKKEKVICTFIQKSVNIGQKKCKYLDS